MRGRVFPVVAVALALLVTGCRAQIGKPPGVARNLTGVFAYFDPSGSPAVFDLGLNKVIWDAGEKRKADGLAWSPTGSTLAYVALDGNQLSLVCHDFIDGTQKAFPVSAQGLDLDTYGLMAEVSFSPSGKYVTIRGPGYPTRTLRALETVTGRVVLDADGASFRWVDNNDTLSYGLPVYDRDKDLEVNTSDLALADLSSGQVKVVVKAKPGHWLFPAYWSKDCGLVFGDGTAGIGQTYWDLSGRPADPPKTTPRSVPEAAGHEVGEVLSGESVDPTTGLTLFPARKDGATFIWLYSPDLKAPIRVVEGTLPLWRP